MGVTWLKTGEASKKLAEQQAAEAEKKKESYGKLFRFWLKEGEEASITFVDGVLSAEGYLTPTRFYEHNLTINGQYGNTYVCPAMSDPESKVKCPICAGGDKPDLVALFTIIDHRKFTGKGGKVYENTRKLLVAKPRTFEMLNKIAVKRGGLAGARFDVSRSSEKAARIGDMFDFMSKATPEEIPALKAKYTRTYQTKDKDGKPKDVTVCEYEVADYEKEIEFKTVEELVKMGFGPGGTPNVAAPPPQEHTEAAGEDFDKHL